MPSIFVTDTFYEEPTTTELSEDFNESSKEIKEQETTTEIQGIKDIDILEQPKEMDTDFPHLFDKVTPNRIHHMLHELTTSKGIDGVGKVSQFSLFHGNSKQKKLNTAKITEHFMRKVSNSYIDNMKTLLKDDLDKEDVNLESVNEIIRENDSHLNETEAVDEEASRVIEHDTQNSLDNNIAETYGDNMEFFESKTIFNEALQHVINERELLNYDNSLTMSTYDSNDLLLKSTENEIDDEIYRPKQQKKEDSRVSEENEVYVIYVTEDGASPVEAPLISEEFVAETKMTPDSRQEMFKDSPYSYFDDFGIEAFSSPRQRIAQHFNQIVQRPWQTNYAWRR